MKNEIATLEAASIETGGKFIGARVQRTEDEKLLRGQGQFVDDLKLENVL